MSSDTFFTQTHCDRCLVPLKSRTMSWFTEETICFKCSKKEEKIKKSLKSQGKDLMEGCGYIPDTGNGVNIS